MRKSTQYYSLIAAKYLSNKHIDSIMYGDIATLNALFDLFGKHKNFADTVETRNYKAQYVLNKLDIESRRPDAIFIKTFVKSHLSHKGIIERQARCFVLKQSTGV